ncbi:hypothetical protein Mgra_00006664 [Meloidogyne graminicola]|uniref:WD_REPEATS_REGION domain-containing protein n=1 Tax=Meloidogyne graminicola TaxID=189291 RepID=A0A8S9ZL61_9BILA|nr:hypothetical protein Mgra_00006664 [Meloidogyne graminicola]
MGTVRFLNDNEKGEHQLGKRYSSIPCSSIGTQSDPIIYTTSGTDPLKAPERSTQTDIEYLLWNRSIVNSLRISSHLVDMLINELNNISIELPLFKAYERSLWGNDFEVERAKRISIQPLREVELPKAESLSSTISPFAIRCGLGSRVAVLFSESEHDSYCTEHLGQILLTLRRRQSNWIQLPACPSDAIFGRHGEILVVGLYNGEFLLFSTVEESIGQVLWSGGGPTAGMHTRSITQLQWMDEHRGILLSIGLDGKVIQSRLEPNNRLQPLDSTQITLADLPKHSYRDKVTESTANRAVGLVGASIFNNWENKQELLIATETGVLIQIGEQLNDIKHSETLIKNESFGEGTAEQFLSLPSGNVGKERIIIWRTSDGRILQNSKPENGQFTPEMLKLLPIGRSKSEFILADNSNLLFTLCNKSKQKTNLRKMSGKTELIVWDILKGELLLHDAQIGENLVAINIDKRGGNVMVGIINKEDNNTKLIGGERQKKYFLIFYEIIIE